ncbi:BTAD domain-containing putative transcriptional regulator [Streptomyces sp. NPDC052077]|uniref:AfsR/SARP family transcriptional regulator n=1 Tax=Streptomyces sp. NPDC052077 TaxID=3154757 RepID=UPI003442D2B4
MGLRFSVLGPLALTVDGRPRPLGPLKQRLVLAVLLCHANQPVTVDRLTDAVWEDEPPRTARKNLQVYVSALRKLLDGPAAGRLVCQDSGYTLRVEPGELDSLRFAALARQGRAAGLRGEQALCAGLLGRALGLWRGDPLAELRCSPQVQEAVRRLDADRAGVFEDWAEAELASGHAEAVADGLRAAAERHPLRERLQAARMSALHLSGRRTEALAVYDEVRQQLARELGLPPGARLAALHRTVLGDGDGGGRGAPAASAVPGPGPGCLLPPGLADFTGREDPLRELEGALWRGRDALVTGAAGAGKTVLAVHAARRLAGRFPDGLLLVGLRTAAGHPRPPASVVGEVARLAGLDRAAADPGRTAALCRGWLSRRRVLLVLDDAADEATARMLLPGEGHGRVLVTARAQLAGLAGVTRVGLPAYTEAEALELLARIAGAERLARDPAAARRIVAAGGMLPLAVRVSGNRLAVLRHLPLAEYAARLADPGAALGELAAGDVAVRPRLEASWRDLSEEGRGALLRIARLPVGVPFTLGESAEALGCGTDEALRRLERLIEAGAVGCPGEEVSAHSARYTVPRLLQSYVREHTGADGVGGTGG